ncbi:TetR/AcrR family transcriptional regulator [Gordonia lacunae]|uniref:TetR family transcriptional regulator n=1 Tax=Gordonia lacunae TaxID=417102 RepID=A0A243QFV4_9ACTN|nr:TetR/AcrR family transcriptional regulator [Gordonia lacunae]OUC79674.1 TetR family transcriptional regulator [Gordonia lacunae]
MARMTRGERQAATRGDILAAAQARFLQDGYASTSLEQIANDAGYSKGAVYSNFRDKPTLCREVLNAVHEDKLTEVAAIVASNATVEDMIDAIESWFERTLGDVGWTMLEMEFAVVSRNNADMAEMITTVHRGLKATIVNALQMVSTEMGIGAGSDTLVTEFADLIVATTFGLGVQRAVDPSISIRPAVRILETFAEAIRTLDAHNADSVGAEN